MRLLRGADGGAYAQRPLRFVVYDVVYAFQRLEARRLGLLPDRQPAQYAEFRHDFIASLAMWVPRKNPFIDDVRAALAAHAEGRVEELGKHLEQLLRAAENKVLIDPKGNGSRPRKLKTIDRYILDALRLDPNLSEAGLWQQIERDANDLTDDRIGEIEHDGVWVIDPTPKGKTKSQRYTRSSMRSRLSRVRRNRFSQ